MSKYVNSICISAFFTTIFCATGVRLIAGPTKWEGIAALFFLLLPVVILLFALFLFISENLLKKYRNLFRQNLFPTVEIGKYEKFVTFIGYVEVASGVVSGCIASWITIAYKLIFANLIILTLSSFIFLAGLLLLRKFKIGLYLSIIAQLLSVIQFSTPEHTFYFGNLINFTVGIKFIGSTFAVNIVSILFIAVLLLSIKQKPDQTATLNAQKTVRS